MVSIFKWMSKLPWAPNRKMMGKDFAGNVYYELPEIGAKARRVVYSEIDEAHFDNQSIPLQWNGDNICSDVCNRRIFSACNIRNLI